MIHAPRRERISGAPCGRRPPLHYGECRQSWPMPSSSGERGGKDRPPRVLRVPSEPGAASIERDRADVAGPYPVECVPHVGRLRHSHDAFATHEPNGIEHYLGIEAELRVGWNAAEERHGKKWLYRRID